MHKVIDDHSRTAYAEIRTDEKAVPAVGVLRRAVTWFAKHGVTVERVLSDNGPAYKSFAWRDACVELHITHKRTRLTNLPGHHTEAPSARAIRAVSLSR